MSSPGKIERYLLSRVAEDGAIHMTLIDPEEVKRDELGRFSEAIGRLGTTGVMVGGSTLASTTQLDEVVRSLKDTLDLPVILFPNSVTAISRYADAIWFMSLLNSNNPMFITGFQALGAPVVKRYGLEAIPLAYLIVGGGSTAAYIGQAHEIPMNKPEVAALYALAAQYFGMRFVYLEAGSGAETPVPPDMIKRVTDVVDLPVIVGGGIRTPEDAARAVNAGASIVVTGTIGEEDRTGMTVKEIVVAVREAAEKRRRASQ